MAILDRLVEACADVDKQLKQPFSTMLGVLWRSLGFQHRLGKRTRSTTICRNILGCTPLMMAVMAGQDEGVAALISAGARLDIKNCRNKTALDLAYEVSAPDEILDALEGVMGACESMTRMASISATNSILSF